jgi:hypothetical protein
LELRVNGQILDLKKARETLAESINRSSWQHRQLDVPANWTLSGLFVVLRLLLVIGTFCVRLVGVRVGVPTRGERAWILGTRASIIFGVLFYLWWTGSD